MATNKSSAKKSASKKRPTKTTKKRAVTKRRRTKSIASADQQIVTVVATLSNQSKPGGYICKYCGKEYTATVEYTGGEILR